MRDLDVRDAVPAAGRPREPAAAASAVMVCGGAVAVLVAVLLGVLRLPDDRTA